MIRDVLNFSSFDFPSTHSSTAFPPLPASSNTSSFHSLYSSRSSWKMLTLSRGSHNLFALDRSRESAVLSGSSLSQLSENPAALSIDYQHSDRYGLSEKSLSELSGNLAALSIDYEPSGHSAQSGSSLGQLSENLAALPIDHQQSGHSVLSRNSLSSIALSQCSHPTIWTMYRYPVPGSITSSDPHQFQLQRSEREYVFVQRPFAMPLSRVNSWLRNNFFESPASRHEDLDSGIVGANQDGPSGSWIGHPNQSDRQTTFLMNAQKTEVILSGIPADVTKNYSSPLLQMVCEQTRGSMIELHHTEKWSPANIYSSLPNIYEEIGLRNGVSFNIQGMKPLNALTMHPRPNSSVDERDDILDDAMDSISVVCEKVERRDQALRDAARGRSMS